MTTKCTIGIERIEIGLKSHNLMTSMNLDYVVSTHGGRFAHYSTILTP